MAVTYKCKKCKGTARLSMLIGEKAAKNTTAYKKKLCPRCLDNAYDWKTGKKK